MSRRPLLLVLLALLLVGTAACGAEEEPAPAPVAEEGDEVRPGAWDDPECDATAVVDGVSYHVVRITGEGYDLDPAAQVTGTATDCDGGSSHPVTFHALPGVDPGWAICGMVEGAWRVFLADDLGPVPANSPLTRIVLGY